MKNKIKGFDRLRQAITLSAVGSAGLLAVGTGRAGSTSVCQTHNIQVSSVVTSGTRVNVTFRNATVYASSVLLSTPSVSHNSPNCSSLRGTSSGSIAAFGIQEGSIFLGSGSPDRGSTSTLGDAFDGYGGIFLDGAPYNDTDGIVDITGSTLTTDPDTMPNGLSVSSQYHVFTNKRVTRIIHSLYNPTATTITTRAAIGGNLGSDDSTTIPNTSNNNQTVELGDTWVITHDGSVYAGIANGDPILTHVVASSEGIDAIPLQIPGGGGQPAAASKYKSNKEGSQTQGGPPSASDNISFGYDVEILAGETQHLVWFVQMSDDIDEANTSLPNYTNTDAAIAAGLYINLPAGMTGNGINWAAPAAVLAPPVNVPVFSPISLVLLFGLFGFAASRSLRKVK